MNQNKKGEYKVVIQLSSKDVEIQKALINQINNLLKALPNIIIEVVVHSHGINFLLKESPLSNNIEKLNSSSRVLFLACSNTLNSLQLNSSALLSSASVIESGVAHLVLRQQNGWSYLKAG